VESRFGPSIPVDRAQGPAPIGDDAEAVCAGVEPEATDKARSYMVGALPSSPSMALFKD
jgi:putative YphP/YqiW family bacilliredoxin